MKHEGSTFTHGMATYTASQARQYAFSFFVQDDFKISAYTAQDVSVISEA
jgi:hypothetical protein